MRSKGVPKAFRRGLIARRNGSGTPSERLAWRLGPSGWPDEPVVARTHPRGLRGSRSVYSAAAQHAAAAIVRARGQKQKGWLDHEGFRLWFEGTAQPTNLTSHLQKLLAPYTPDASVRDRLKRSRDNGLRISEELVAQFLHTPAAARSPPVRAFRKRLSSPLDLHSALIALVQMAFGRTPAWDTGAYRSLDDPSELSLQELLGHAIGLASDRPEHARAAQPLFSSDPFTLPLTLALLTRAGGLAGIASALASATAPLAIEDLNVARDVVWTFSANAEAFTRSARLYYGRDAIRPGSVYTLFDIFRRVSVKDRPDARLAALIVVGAAIVIRTMLATGLLRREALEQLMAAINETARTCRAFIALVEATPPADRRYLMTGGQARLERLPPAERQRLAGQIDVYLQEHPEDRAALGVPTSGLGGGLVVPEPPTPGVAAPGARGRAGEIKEAVE